MPDAYEIYDARYIQSRQAVSAANALNIGIGPVPAGVVWTIIAAVMASSAAETQDYWFAVYDGTTIFPVTWPQELAQDPAISKNVPLVREGMEIKLFPGDMIYGYRDAAVAGSTLELQIRLIESPLPIYREYEPQEDQRQRKAVSAGGIFRRVGASVPQRSITRPASDTTRDPRTRLP